MDNKVIEHGNGLIETHYSDGTKVWSKNGAMHREDGPAMEHANGDREWYIKGLHHRADGPAVERANNSKRWYRYGKLHRDDGPAIEGSDGKNEWALNGKILTEKEVNTIFWNKELSVELSVKESTSKKLKI
jgi:hypothetical protein